MTVHNTAPHRLTDLFRGRTSGQDVHYHAIELLYTNNLHCEIRVEIQEPHHMADYLRAAFYGTDPLLTRFSNKTHDGNVFINVPGTVTIPGTANPDRRLARLCFHHAEKPSEICFGEDFESLFSESPRQAHEGPSLNDFITALEKAGDDWRLLNLRPRPVLRLL